eukprot:NODE_886_length_1394_cov_54.356877_g740_i0.p3 GENE.NODE_886_length_1394_cov_54.356877_g740_i0~~NODE_886_length_1394_cov_54.356877_g740_i0.p3  ORF type:complete len:52 (+),score=1.09 NODE_886_length_1394_cov_54.356877_g740_i0:274-429(+)
MLVFFMGWTLERAYETSLGRSLLVVVTSFWHNGVIVGQHVKMTIFDQSRAT